MSIEVPHFAGLAATTILGRKIGRALRRDAGWSDPSLARADLTKAVSARLPARYRNHISEITTTLIRASNANGLDPFLVLAIAVQESGLNPRALGRDGEIGLLQIKPATARWLARQKGWLAPLRHQLFDARMNIEFGTAYLAWLRDRLGHDHRLFISAYNRGPAAPQRRINGYLDRVAKHYHSLIRHGVSQRTLEAQRDLKSDPETDTIRLASQEAKAG